MSTLRTLITAGVATLTLLGCKPPGGDGDEGDGDEPATPIELDDAPALLAEQVCAQLFACSCPSAVGYEDEAECVATKTAEIEVMIDPIIGTGGTWSAECAGELAQTWSQWACLGPTSASREASYSSRTCPIVKGTLALGADCSVSGLGDNCQPGLACIDQVCVESPTFPIAVGGVCEYNWDTLPCESGAICDWNEDYTQRTCQTLPQAGDSCTGNSLCGPAANDLICNGETATCEPAPGVGEPCFQEFLCGPGTYCDGGKDFTCQPRVELGDGCGADAVCPVDASCVGNLCVADAAAVCGIQLWF
ncbi:hypothetical protein [Enhygromyxa salina]|uniref:hypothetical protein n=1 Tax=Enhygromyxa salina TaxID=215803 RepID=UPI0011B1F420|nr:hypothetical protein [Enhygromyxa salina]